MLVNALQLAFGVLFALLLGAHTPLAFSIATILLGFSLAWLATQFLYRAPGHRHLEHFHPIRVARFIWDFAVDLTMSNLRMAWDVLTPTDLHRVHLIYVPIDDLSDTEIVLLSHRITLTPGTLTCDATFDRKFLIVHIMYPEGGEMWRSLRRPIDILKGNA